MKPIQLIQFAWIIEVAVLVIVAVILIFGLPARVPAYVSMLPLLSGLIVAQGGALPSADRPSSAARKSRRMAVPNEKNGLE